ncbi:hypothetical protein FG386_001553 [Cryptosporidium ryanae]|uniref:uncharacterized protein n=1 Tax=Cryptosporidium ryanae TaxID=515981 RepID=UPI003519DD7C|nr:hypothetical protein FG386_001553 [Cryptosporidium ryanae]
MDITVLERYLRDKYGIESVLEDKKKEILDLLGNKIKNDDWKKKLDNFILNIDIRQYFIGKQMKSIENLNFGNLLTMIVKFNDCSKSKKQYNSDIMYNNESEDEYSDFERDTNTKNKNDSNRIYNLTLTTGKLNNNDTHDVMLNCIEYEKIKLFNDQSIAPGTKLLLNSNIMIINSIIILNNNNFEYLGGKVNDMLESWKLNNLLTEYCSRKLINSKNTLNKPPKFVPFVNKDTDKKNLINKVTNAEITYEKNKELTSNSNQNELDSLIEKKFDDIFKNYNDFIVSINNKKKSNVNNNINILGKFNIIKENKTTTKNDKARKTNVYSNSNNDPGAPVKMYRGKFKSEIIDSEAKNFIVSKDTKSNISLFDHLFSKLNVSDSNTNKITNKNKNKV